MLVQLATVKKVINAMCLYVSNIVRIVVIIGVYCL